MPNIDIPKLNQIFALAVNLCRYCGGTCEMSMRECNGARRFGREDSLPKARLEAYPYSECPNCKQTIRGYQGMLWIWKGETNG